GGGDARALPNRSREGPATRQARGRPASGPFDAEGARGILVRELEPDGVDEACIAEALRQVEGRLAAGGEAITSPLRLAEELARSAHRDHLERQAAEAERQLWEQARAAGAEALERPCHHGRPPGETCDACREEGAALRAGGWRIALASARPHETPATG
ncbi:MAG: hypothetical protein ACRDJF_05485, partial [Actinomycetota bacterium]